MGIRLCVSYHDHTLTFTYSYILLHTLNFFLKILYCENTICFLSTEGTEQELYNKIEAQSVFVVAWIAESFGLRFCDLWLLLPKMLWRQVVITVSAINSSTLVVSIFYNHYVLFAIICCGL